MYSIYYREAGCDLLDLLGVFVAHKNNDWINVNAVEPFDGVRCNVEQTVAALQSDRERKTEFRLGLKINQECKK